jgi:hypothetical protein
MKVMSLNFNKTWFMATAQLKSFSSFAFFLKTSWFHGCCYWGRPYIQTKEPISGSDNLKVVLHCAK